MVGYSVQKERKVDRFVSFQSENLTPVNFVKLSTIRDLMEPGREARSY